MRAETQTREKLLKVAKEEFMAKGYASASLRNICKNANVTTGALYFFFKDKEDLFGSLVSDPLEKIYTTMKEHYEGEIQDIKKTAIDTKDMNEDSEAALMIVNYMFQYHDEFVLLLNKSQGSKYENLTDEFVIITEKHYRVISDKMCEAYNIDRIDDYIIHWVAHLQIFFICTVNYSQFDKRRSFNSNEDNHQIFD